MKGSLRIFAAAVAIALAMGNARAELKHRYSFAQDAKDTAGAAHGTLLGTASVADGALVLDGTVDTCVQLPADVIKGYTALTIETWATFGVNGNWPRLFDFGDSNAAGQGKNYLFLTPHSGPGDTRLVISDADPGFSHELIVSQAGTLDDTGKVYLAAVVDPLNGTLALYTNGVLAISRNDSFIELNAVSNVLNYIGKSLYGADAYLNATIDEFRIHDSALTPPQIAASFAAGPDKPDYDPGQLQAITLQLDRGMIIGGLQQPVVYADFAKVKKVNLTGFVDVSFSSSPTGIITVTSAGLLRGAALGNTTVTATYLDQKATAPVTVAPVPAVLKYRYSFGDAVTATNVVDSVSGANGMLVGGATLAGNGKVTLDGASGYVDLPNGMISKMTNATFEIWVTWAGANAWQRIFEFGSSNLGEDQVGTGATYLFLTPQSGPGTVRFAATSGSGESPVLNGPTPLTIDQETHVAVAYSASTRVARLYMGGRLVASAAANTVLRNIRDVNNWLGRSNFGADPFFNGQINEFRIYEGVLTDSEIAFSAAAGPETLGRDPGAFKSLSLTASTNALIAGGVLVSAQLLANYEKITGVNVTSLPGVTFTSSDAAVISVSTNGVLDGMAAGSAVITASYQGLQATATFTVSEVPGTKAPVLAHRYSFGEGPGSRVVKDSVGGADGELMGTGTFNGGQLSLTGTDGYVNLPNGIISSLNNATFEGWTTWRGTRVWERIFDFGSSSGGEDAQGTGLTYLFLSPLGGSAAPRFAITVNSGAGENPVLNSPTVIAANRETHFAVTYNFAAGSARLFINGKLQAIGAAIISLSEIDDVNVWLGRSNWPDANYLGALNEFRIYDGALTSAQVAAHFAAGPDTLPSDQPPVQLRVTQGAAGITLAWPAAATGFALESTASLGAGATWSAVTQAPATANGQTSVTVPVTGANQFFRLKK